MPRRKTNESDRSSKEKKKLQSLLFILICFDNINETREREIRFFVDIHIYLFTYNIHDYISTPVMYRFYTDTNRS